MDGEVTKSAYLPNPRDQAGALHDEQTVYCEGETPFEAVLETTAFTPGQAFLDAELCTNNGLGYNQEDCVSVARLIDIQSK
jgi:hypothetical protein